MKLLYKEYVYNHKGVKVIIQEKTDGGLSYHGFFCINEFRHSINERRLPAIKFRLKTLIDEKLK